MNALINQLRDLPTVNLAAYLFGLLAIMASMIFIHGIKPAYTEKQELQVEHKQLTRLAGKFDLVDLQLSLEETKEKQQQVRASMLEDIPDRNLETSLPTILESLHRAAKQHGLRTQKLQPGEVKQNTEIATAPVAIQVIGRYQNIYTWIHDFSKQIEGVSVTDIRADGSPGSNGQRTMAMNLVIYGR